MAKQKKDGRKINLIIDQKIFNRLVYYTNEKGQTMTTAIERILDKYFDEEGIPKDFSEK